MIRFIVAIDSKMGLADDHGIPWDLPTDKAYFRTKTLHTKYLIGYGTYKGHKQPLPDRHTFVATNKPDALLPGFEGVSNARKFLENAKTDIWVGGGAGLFASVLDLADELYITRIDADFNCTKFFPKFEDKFKLVSSTKPQTENGSTFHFEVWDRK